MCAGNKQLKQQINTQHKPNMTLKIPNVARRAIAKAELARAAGLCVEEDAVITQDILARSTGWLRKGNEWLYQGLEQFEHTPLYKILFQTTQPAHFVTLIAVVIVASLLLPSERHEHQPSMAANLLYLASFMLHFGSQIWMTFVSGLSLYFAMPRHVFGSVQRVLFPKYFSLNSALSLVTLVIFVKCHDNALPDRHYNMQVGTMTLCFLCELAIRLYLTPPLLGLMDAKGALEAAAGTGTEVGCFQPGALAMCPRYRRVHRAFRRCHIAIAMGNLLSIACTTFHAHYLATKICI